MFEYKITFVFKSNLCVCHFSPRTSSQFCRDSARSLVAAYNDGALPCDCDTSGSTGIVCDAVGGQCHCRPHVIGRQCTKCATGYFGFPFCRRESSFTPCYLLSKYNLHLILSSLRSSLRSVWLWPPTMRRSDGTLHLPSSDSQTGLRCVSESDFQLPPFAGLWELWMLPKRHRCKCGGSVWPQYWSVQVSWNLHEEQTVRLPYLHLPCKGQINHIWKQLFQLCC